MKLAHFAWKKDPDNPILPPVKGSLYDSHRCMNPFMVKTANENRLYYSGGTGREFRQRICLAISTKEAPHTFRRLGVILDNGSRKEDFDSLFCVLPCVHKFAGKWHMYYTGRDSTQNGLQSFSGIGLAVSDDGIHFTKYSPTPVITGDQTAEFPDNKGIAGGGSILEYPQENGSTIYRMYYTIAAGTPSPDKRIDQEKHCAVCHSRDGINWHDHRIILSPRKDVTNEDVAVAAPFVWRDNRGYRMIYSGIGTRWQAYSLSEAFSEDGYTWQRGNGNENLTLAPDPASPWESEMVEYANVIPEGNSLRLYYCGNGYGSTGIGTATAQIQEF